MEGLHVLVIHAGAGLLRKYRGTTDVRKWGLRAQWVESFAAKAGGSEFKTPMPILKDRHSHTVLQPQCVGDGEKGITGTVDWQPSFRFSERVSPAGAGAG